MPSHYRVMKTGNYFRVVDSDGLPLYLQFETEADAQRFADRLNARLPKHSTDAPLPADTQAVLLIETKPSRPGLLARLGRLASKARAYKAVRVGL